MRMIIIIRYVPIEQNPESPVYSYAQRIHNYNRYYSPLYMSADLHNHFVNSKIIELLWQGKIISFPSFMNLNTR